LIRQHHGGPGFDRGNKRRNRHGPQGAARHHHHAIPLTDEGVPAAVADAPKPSPVVAVTTESRVRYPWLPARVIAGSVWRGPEQGRVRVDEHGDAAPWRCGAH
jgi:hypothetical protein